MSLETGIIALAETIGSDVRELKTGKVDKVSGKGLSDANFTQVEKTKLDGVATGATKNRADSANADKVHSHTTEQITGLDTTLGSKASKTELTTGLGLKVDKVAGKGLSTEDYTSTAKDKLDGIASEATKNRSDTLNADKVHIHTTAQVTGLDTALGSKASKTELTDGLGLKVDKVTGKGLSDTNFTQVEKTKLTSVADSATANRSDSLNADKVHTHTTEQVTGLDTALGTKVDKVTGKGLSSTDFTQVEKTKLAGVATGATANRADTLNADKTHTHTTAQVTGLDTALGNKVDKVVGKVLSDRNFTQAEKDKLSSLESSKFVGLFVSEDALPLSGSEGDYANVDGGVGSDVYRVIWDSSDSKWVKMQGVSTDLTPAQIKQQYESNQDTNAFTDDEKVKLASVANNATANRADSLNANKAHTHAISDVTGLATRLSDIDDLSGDVESINLKIGDLSQLPTQAKENLVAALNELLGEVTLGFSYFHEHMAQIDDAAGLGDTDVTWSADKSIRELDALAETIDTIDTDVESLNLKIGDINLLPTLARDNLVNAFLELVTVTTDGFSHIMGLIPPIDDTAGLGDTDVTWSADKTVTSIQAAVNTLVDGAPAELNTINKLATAITTDGNLTQTMITQINNRVRFDEAQVLTAEQQLIACANIGVGNPTRDFAAYYEAAKL